MVKPKVHLLLDSGVFSAWRRETDIGLPTYIKYLKQVKDYLLAYVTIDKIPGVFGQKRTQSEVEESAKVGYSNTQKMKEAGLSPIPIFHQGERFYWLERMLKDGEPYIGISSAKDIWAREQRQWLDEVYTILTDNDGRPLVKTHGFGITRPAFLYRYPFSTSDSTAWSLAPGYGSILIPVYKNGEWDYTQPPIKFVLSGVPHVSRSSQKRQFEGQGPITRDLLTKYLEEVVGVSVAEARYGTNIRRQAMLVYYRNLEKALTDVRFIHRSHHSLLSTVQSAKGKPIKHNGLRIMFATNLNKEWSTMMNDLNCPNRLLSYWELKDKDPEVLIEYVKNGIVGTYKKAAQKHRWNSEGYRNFRRLSLLDRLNNDVDVAKIIEDE